MKNGFQKGAAEVGNGKLNIVSDVTFAKDSVENYPARVDELMKTKPEVIVISAIAPASTKIMNAIIAKGHKPVFFCMSPCMSDDFPGDITAGYSDLFHFQSAPLPDNAQLGIVKSYIADAKAAGSLPTPSGIEGYMHAKIAVEALTLAGKELTRDKFRKALDTGFRDYDLGGIKFTFTETDH